MAIITFFQKCVILCCNVLPQVYLRFLSSAGAVGLLLWLPQFAVSLWLPTTSVFLISSQLSSQGVQFASVLSRLSSCPVGLLARVTVSLCCFVHAMTHLFSSDTFLLCVLDDVFHLVAKLPCKVADSKYCLCHSSVVSLYDSRK